MEYLAEMYKSINEWWNTPKTTEFKKPDAYKNINTSSILKKNINTG